MKSSSKEISAGLLMYRIHGGQLEVFLIHPGGPYFRRKDDGYWGIPKGLLDPGEDPLQAAIREFKEETGMDARGEFIPMGEITQKSGKIVRAWAFAFSGDWDENKPLSCNTFEMEWPPHSGKMQTFPEADQGCFFTIKEAKKKMIEAQQTFLERLQKYLRLQTTD